jgi:beta-lactamase regulating signal transducer with metallopeptidase domain
MPILIQYLLKLSISLAVLWLFYQLVLRRLTFYNCNRWFLVGYSVLAFFIPLINVSPALQRTALMHSDVVQMIPVVQNFTNVEKTFALSIWDWAYILFATGCVALLFRLVIQHISFLRLRRSAKLILESPVKVYQVNEKIMPFSFGNSIFINQDQHSDEELREIVRHEFIHVRQKHSIDMLFAEWLCILNWYNPFAWLIRKAVRQNLEYIADSKVVQTGIDKKEYQYLLLKVIGVSHYSIATNFNFSSLKNRIAMMNKMESGKAHLIKFLFVLPLIAAMLLAFRARLVPTANNNDKTSNAELIVQDTIPKQRSTPATAVIRKDSLGKNAVKITISKADGTKEEYNLDNPEEKAAYEKKYRIMPAAPAQVSRESDVTPPDVPSAPHAGRLPGNIRSIQVINEKATVKLKNGKIETYDLSKPDERQSFEKKYGDITPPPPPPPPAAPEPPDAPVEPVKASTITVTGIEPVVSVTTEAPVVAVTHTLSADLIELQPSIHSLSPGDKEELIAEISSQTTKEKLDLLKKQLRDKGYTISFIGMHFKDDILQSVDGTISDKASTSRFLAEDFNKIMISQITYKNGTTGFYIRIVEGTIKM